MALPYVPLFSALVVDPDPSDRMFVVSALASAGFTVSATDNFHDAKGLLNTRPPLVLVTEIRLSEYNGLQLVMRATSVKPAMTVIVASGFADPVLKREAERAGATYAAKPMTREEFLAAVYRTALRRPNADGVLEPIEPPFERRQTERRRDSSGTSRTERRLLNRRRDIAELLRRAAAL